ncbi:MAG TPA: isoamylase early set domain-containing protein [Saprospiraceae bacterium]|nr:isoamylase early set domain-containing protein [Saprospiraceae bacterium]
MSIIKKYQPAKGTCKVTFSYPASKEVKKVQLLGDFNNWDSAKAPLLKGTKGELSTVVELAAGQTYEFRYLLDGNTWDNDNNADTYVSSPFGGIQNSVIVLDAVVGKAPKAVKAAAPKAAKAAAPKAAKTAAPKAAKTAAPKATKTAAPKAAKVAAPKAAKVAAPKAAKAAAPKAAKVAAPKVAKVVAPKESTEETK